MPKLIEISPTIVDNLYREQYWIAYPILFNSETFYADIIFSGSWRTDAPSPDYLIENMSCESLVIKAVDLTNIGFRIIIIGK